MLNLISNIKLCINNEENFISDLLSDDEFDAFWDWCIDKYNLSSSDDVGEYMETDSVKLSYINYLKKMHK